MLYIKYKKGLEQAIIIKSNSSNRPIDQISLVATFFFRFSSLREIPTLGLSAKPFFPKLNRFINLVISFVILTNLRYILSTPKL